MGVFGVMYILALGYRYNVSVPHKNNILKRSSGWVSYIVLAIDGIISILFGLIALSILSLIAILISIIINFGFNWQLNEVGNFVYNLFVYSHSDTIKAICFGVALFFSYLANEVRLRNNAFKTDYEELKSIDGVLNIIIHAMESGSYIKVSLKSGKVYIGAVLGEQFEHGDLDNITILPMESGYRDKDTLNLTLNCDYKSVYLNHGVIERTHFGLHYHPERAEDMMMVIRVNQIESLSLFDSMIYKEFEYKSAAKRVILD